MSFRGFVEALREAKPDGPRFSQGTGAAVTQRSPAVRYHGPARTHSEGADMTGTERRVTTYDVIYRAIEGAPKLFKAIYQDVLEKPTSKKVLAAALDAVDAYLDEHYEAHLKPLLGYLKKQDRVVPLSEISFFVPAFADTMSTPGPATCAPTLENSATVSPPELCPRAATDRNPSDTAGGLTPITKSGFFDRWLSFPAAATSSTVRPKSSRDARNLASRSNMRTLMR